jgi:hypothetical protein
MTEPHKDNGIRSIQLSTTRAHIVLPCVDLNVAAEPRRFSAANRAVIASKLWAWRRWVNVEYQCVGIGRFHLRWVELRLRSRLWLTRIRLIERLRRRPSEFRVKAITVARTSR